MFRRRLSVLFGSFCLVAGFAAVVAPQAIAARSAKASVCWNGSPACAEIANPQDVWGSWYVGHDEPSLLFYSNQPGSGNQMTYTLKIPSDPRGSFSLKKSYNFELRPAFWFGMAMCDTQSYPETVSTCTPDSDSNAVDVTKSVNHPGAAFTELQFYPPGWVKQFNGFSCDLRKWCAALTIDSLSENPINGTELNATCQNEILGGLEYVNFAYLTRNGVPQGPPNPLDFEFVGSGYPGPSVLYMNSGDTVTVTLHDSPSGLVTSVDDRTTGQSGFMTASAANGFGQIQFAPTGTSCTEIPYNFHPMYSTSSPETSVPWAAHTYNIAFSDEIGHFQYCTSVDPTTGNCNGLEGLPGDQQPADEDDVGCFDASQSLLYPVTGCAGTNTPGFDGPSYLPDWPDRSPKHPTAALFSSPRTVGGAPYSQAAFEVDMPRIEASDFGGVCDRLTGVGCVNPPLTDQGVPAAFYPYYSTVRASNGRGSGQGNQSGCMWGIGSTLPKTINNFGGSSTKEFGPLLSTNYYVFGGGGATQARYNNFQRVLPNNPC